MSRPRRNRMLRFGTGIRLTALSCAAGLTWALASPADPPASSRALVDPTKPARLRSRSSTAPSAARPAFTLSAIVVSAGRRVAVINGRSVKPGDRIDGARVVAIDPYRVQLETDGKRFALEMVQQPIDKRKVESDR